MLSVQSLKGYKVGEKMSQRKLAEIKGLYSGRQSESLILKLLGELNAR